MAKDVFDTPPQGMTRKGKKGWLSPVQTPQTVKSNKLKKENEDLRIRLAILEDAVLRLTKKTKKNKVEE